MSHIDTINHSHIGFLAGIPVYHPLESDREYGLTPRTIAVGGGSGEHEIFLIKDIDACVMSYIRHFCEYDDYKDLKDDYQAFLYKSFWSISASYHFYKQIKKELKFLEIHSAESYIILSIAEFLIYSGSHLVRPDILKKAQELIDSPTLYTINQSPVGYRTSGKIIVDNQVQWGYSFEDEKRDYLKKQNI